jgi:hypothetical protein
VQCLDENTVLSYLAGPRRPEVQHRVEAHVDTCPACRKLMADCAARDSTLAAPSSGARPVSRPQRVAPNTLVGRFRVLSHLGGGGMGDVYLAEDTALGRRVALKLIQRRWVESQEALTRFQIEARATARLRHRHIVTIHEIGAFEGMPYLALEYLEGRTLAEHALDASGVALLPVTEVLRIGQAIAEALAEAHRNGVVHRDLKPANVHVGQRGEVRVLDFGLAKIADVDPAASLATAATATDHTQLAGTPLYIPPERWEGRASTPAADVWALGVVLHELASGARPFSGPNGHALARAILTEDPPALDPQLPAGLRQLVSDCLAKAPERRPTAAAAAEALRQLLAPEAPSPRGGARRRWPWLALGALAAAVGATAWWQLRDTPAPETEPRVQAAKPAPSRARSTSPAASLSPSAPPSAPAEITYEAFRRQAELTGKPARPADYKPRVGERALAGFRFGQWDTTIVARIEGERYHVRYEGDEEPSGSTLLERQLLPPPRADDPARPKVGGYVLANMWSYVWQYARVVEVQGDKIWVESPEQNVSFRASPLVKKLVRPGEYVLFE